MHMERQRNRSLAGTQPLIPQQPRSRYRDVDRATRSDLPDVDGGDQLGLAFICVRQLLLDARAQSAQCHQPVLLGHLPPLQCLCSLRTNRFNSTTHKSYSPNFCRNSFSVDVKDSLLYNGHSKISVDMSGILQERMMSLQHYVY